MQKILLLHEFHKAVFHMHFNNAARETCVKSFVDQPLNLTHEIRYKGQNFGPVINRTVMLEYSFWVLRT